VIRFVTYNEDLVVTQSGNLQIHQDVSNIILSGANATVRCMVAGEQGHSWLPLAFGQ
jgi:hypothetical protein